MHRSTSIFLHANCIKLSLCLIQKYTRNVFWWFVKFEKLIYCNRFNCIKFNTILLNMIFRIFNRFFAFWKQYVDSFEIQLNQFVISQIFVSNAFVTFFSISSNLSIFFNYVFFLFRITSFFQRRMQSQIEFWILTTMFLMCRNFMQWMTRLNQMNCKKRLKMTKTRNYWISTFKHVYLKYLIFNICKINIMFVNFIYFRISMFDSKLFRQLLVTTFVVLMNEKKSVYVITYSMRFFLKNVEIYRCCCFHFFYTKNFRTNDRFYKRLCRYEWNWRKSFLKKYDCCWVHDLNKSNYLHVDD